MSVRVTALLLVTALTACAHAPGPAPAPPVSLSIREIPSKVSPSPLVEVQVGDVRGAVPRSWTARMLSPDLFPQQGFVASPRLDAWQRGAPGIPGMEAFWVDVDRLGISSEYYYLAARNASFGQLPASGPCGTSRATIIANHPPDFSGATFSRSDYVASARGTCVTEDGTPMRWAYVVAAPGYGPVRQIGIPSSGLYVVMAEVSGPNAEILLKQMLQGASFGDTTLNELVQAAGGQLR